MSDSSGSFSFSSSLDEGPTNYREEGSSDLSVPKTPVCVYFQSMEFRLNVNSGETVGVLTCRS